MPGAVLYREGSDEPLTIASAEAVADGPGWRIRFREVTSRDAADTLAAGVSRDARSARTADLARGEVYWHEVIGVPVRGIDGTELGVVQDIYRVAENEVYIVGGGAVRHVRPARGPCVHPDLRAAPRRDRRRRRGARPAAAQGARERPRPTACAAPDVARNARLRRRRRGGGRCGRVGSRPVPDETRARALGVRRAERADRADARDDLMTLEIDVLTLFPAMVPGRSRRASPGGSRNGVLPRSGSTTCASAGSAGIARSTTRRTAAAPAW